MSAQQYGYSAGYGGYNSGPPTGQGQASQQSVYGAHDQIRDPRARAQPQYPNQYNATEQPVQSRPAVSQQQQYPQSYQSGGYNDSYQQPQGQQQQQQQPQYGHTAAPAPNQYPSSYDTANQYNKPPTQQQYGNVMPAQYDSGSSRSYENKGQPNYSSYAGQPAAAAAAEPSRQYHSQAPSQYETSGGSSGYSHHVQGGYQDRQAYVSSTAPAANLPPSYTGTTQGSALPGSYQTGTRDIKDPRAGSYQASQKDSRAAGGYQPAATAPDHRAGGYGQPAGQDHQAGAYQPGYTQPAATSGYKQPAATTAPVGGYTQPQTNTYSQPAPTQQHGGYAQPVAAAKPTTGYAPGYTAPVKTAAPVAVTRPAADPSQLAAAGYNVPFGAAKPSGYSQPSYDYNSQPSYSEQPSSYNNTAATYDQGYQQTQQGAYPVRTGGYTASSSHKAGGDQQAVAAARPGYNGSATAPAGRDGGGYTRSRWSAATAVVDTGAAAAAGVGVRSPTAAVPAARYGFDRGTDRSAGYGDRGRDEARGPSMMMASTTIAGSTYRGTASAAGGSASDRTARDAARPSDKPSAVPVEPPSSSSARRRVRSRSPPREVIPRRQASPPRPRAPEYAVRIPAFSFITVDRDYAELVKRYSRLTIPSDFSVARSAWGVLPGFGDHPLDSLGLSTVVVDQPTKLEHELSQLSTQHVALPDVLDKRQQLDAAPGPDGVRYAVRVLLLQGVSVSEKDACVKGPHHEGGTHLAHTLRFVTGRFIDNHHKRGVLAALGGMWDPSHDGGDPSRGDDALKAAAIRHVKQQAGLDISRCDAWHRICEVRYLRSSDGGSSKSRSSRSIDHDSADRDRKRSRDDRDRDDHKHKEHHTSDYKNEGDKDKSQTSPEAAAAAVKAEGDSKPEAAVGDRHDVKDSKESMTVSAERKDTEKDSKLKEKDKDGKGSEEPVDIPVHVVMYCVSLAPLLPNLVEWPGMYADIQAWRADKNAAEEADKAREKTSSRSDRDKSDSRASSEAPEKDTNNNNKGSGSSDNKGSAKVDKDSDIKKSSNDTSGAAAVAKEESKAPAVVVAPPPPEKLLPEPFIHFKSLHTKDFKIRTSTTTLHSLLDYDEDDDAEPTVELSLFAESFHELLMRDYATAILNELSQARYPASLTSMLVKTVKEEPHEVTTGLDIMATSPRAKRQKTDDDAGSSSVRKGTNTPLLLAFRYFDKTGVGYIKPEDMRRMLHNLGTGLPHRIVKQLVNSAISSKSEKLYYRDLTDKDSKGRGRSPSPPPPPPPPPPPGGDLPPPTTTTAAETGGNKDTVMADADIKPDPAGSAGGDASGNAATLDVEIKEEVAAPPPASEAAEPAPVEIQTEFQNQDLDQAVSAQGGNADMDVGVAPSSDVNIEDDEGAAEQEEDMQQAEDEALPTAEDLFGDNELGDDETM